MKILIPLLCLLFAGCTSTGTVTPRTQVAASAVEDAVSIGLVPVLTKNPTYIGAAQAVASALGAFSGTTLTPEDVNAFLVKTPLQPEDARTVAAIVNATWGTFQRRYAAEVGEGIRPDVKVFLAAVSNGIRNAIAAVPQPAPTAVLDFKPSLVALDEHNRIAGIVSDPTRPRPNGIVCPKCGEELMDTSPHIALTSHPQQYYVGCRSCGYSGTRF